MSTIRKTTPLPEQIAKRLNGENRRHLFAAELLAALGRKLSLVRELIAGNPDHESGAQIELLELIGARMVSRSSKIPKLASNGSCAGAGSFRPCTLCWAVASQ
jgi:hypothetical protein